MQELERTRKCFVAEQNRVAELEEQLAAIAQENQILQSKIVQINTTEEMKSVHEELSILEEVRLVMLVSPFKLATIIFSPALTFAQRSRYQIASNYRQHGLLNIS